METLFLLNTLLVCLFWCNIHQVVHVHKHYSSIFLRYYMGLLTITPESRMKLSQIRCIGSAGHHSQKPGPIVSQGVSDCSPQQDSEIVVEVLVTCIFRTQGYSYP